jgi:hypothetical protein
MKRLLLFALYNGKNRPGEVKISALNSYNQVLLRIISNILLHSYSIDYLGAAPNGFFLITSIFCKPL